MGRGSSGGTRQRGWISGRVEEEGGEWLANGDRLTRGPGGRPEVTQGSNYRLDNLGRYRNRRAAALAVARSAREIGREFPGRYTSGR